MEQAVTTMAENPVLTEMVETANEMNLWDMAVKGGWVMVILALLSVICVYIFVERLVVLKKVSKVDPVFMERIRDYIHDGEIESATKLCKKTDTPYARLIHKGITRIGRPMNDVLVAIENTGNIEVSALGRGFTWLSTTAAAAPMIGFLGTVTGMIEAFFDMSKAGTASNIAVLSDGIYEALVTTVAGLIVGIVALFAYNFLVSRVNRVMNNLEAKTMEFMDLLNEPSA